MKLSCLDADDGTLVWQRDIIEEFTGRNISWENAISPVAVGDLLFIANGGPGESLIAFKKLTGQVAWKTGDEHFTHATPVVTKIQDKEQIIYFVQSGLTERNHQGLGNSLIEPKEDVGSTDGDVEYRKRLGGMLKYYYRQAA